MPRAVHFFGGKSYANNRISQKQDPRHHRRHRFLRIDRSQTFHNVEYR